MNYNFNFAQEYIDLLRSRLAHAHGQTDQEEFKFSHNFIRRLDSVTAKVAKLRGFEYNKDYEFDIDNDTVNVTFPGKKVSLEYPVEILYKEDYQKEYLDSLKQQAVKAK